MMDLPFRLFPPALLAGLIIYLGITLLWLQPLVEQRWAEKELIPQCEANLQHAENSTPTPDNPRKRHLEGLINMYEESGMDKIPFVKQIIEMATQEIHVMQPKRLRVSAIERTGICSCSVDKSFADSHLQMMLHVASFRTHLPSSIKNINQSTIANAQSGICGALPWKG